MFYEQANKRHVCLFLNKTNFVDTTTYEVSGINTSSQLCLESTKHDYCKRSHAYKFLFILWAKFILPFFCTDLKKPNEVKRQSRPFGIFNFSHLSTVNRCRVVYYYLDIVVEVFLKGIEKLSLVATPAKINVIVNQSKVTHLSKLIKQTSASSPSSQIQNI